MKITYCDIFLAVFTISIYGQNHKNAADYRTDAINGNAIAQFYLGQSYFRGWGINLIPYKPFIGGESRLSKEILLHKTIWVQPIVMAGGI